MLLSLTEKHVTNGKIPCNAVLGGGGGGREGGRRRGGEREPETERDTERGVHTDLKKNDRKENK